MPDLRRHAESNFLWACAIVDALVSAGVRHAVMSPGAQMVPVALACRRNQALRCSVVVDERSAAFKALGLARGARAPVILVCTSGSAVGQFYPAIIEANLGMVPLIVLTCDKPPESQFRAVAQAMDQDRIYASHVRASHDLRLPDETIALLPSLVGKLVEASLWPTPGPVHLNLSFRPPLVPAGRQGPELPAPPWVQMPVRMPQPDDARSLARIISAGPGVIVCGPRELGHETAAAISELAAHLNCPVLADSCSGLRFGGHDRSALITHADAVLRRCPPGDAAPAWILRFGGTPTSETVLSWLDGSGAREHIIVEETELWPDPLAQARTTRILRATPALVCRQLRKAARPAPVSWLATFQAEDRRAARILHGLCDRPGPFWEAHIIRRLLASLGDGDTLLVGNSTPIRDFDAFSGTAPDWIRLIANRGSNGIDGGVAFLAGLAEASCGRTVGIIGDLAFSHDVGALQLARGRDVTLVVVNNGGGAIFEYQAVAGIAEFADFLAAPGLDIAALAAAFGWTHHVATEETAFATALRRTRATPGPHLIEAVVDRAASVARHRMFTALVAQDGEGAELEALAPA
ncbi:2-succinyl-5-enolpyruvyl-6-hydroxy-3-cyclohexene-1-carboxylate synthase [Rhodovastum atsumiense]|uniref:2-succinyl-5-enolpyruvyl-6-hydroxy-3-cyclohexene-1-carboxylate synthase n=1 Tax=Rhodovastum atsumiense TaxID=504468 RepID=A0A5M6ISJ9_9PROT|nr:2-succinyl-5-enolpyruvyl-6-hydroxy-3-cyclohexene-1-carboxylic-acid synthase [Rhodovastum atsumiense]KAA5611290.1 2-succinyl-5-enolpyruvyl-6-hydroxy-3-cyclohexene-1-carboxylic-acid synthase [Rhodovastum atsumiense]CAH2601756.1 2-succinyl-5-enolpyruvyl-6-hydroxy-3-cyclohexene-1-carboxylate synthase [Rhodovastum atsumiense]